MSAGAALLTLVAALIASLALSLLLRDAPSGQADGEPGEPSSELMVTWDFRPESLAELTEETPAVVLAKVESVAVGPSTTVGMPGSETEIPSERVELSVVEPIEGTTPERFTLYKLGGRGLQPAEAPAYHEGERYLLFVRPRLNDEGTAPHPDGTWVAVAPDGRFEELASGELEAETEGPVADVLDGETLPEAVEEIEAAEAGEDEATEVAP